MITSVLPQSGLESTQSLPFLFDSVNPDLDHCNIADATFFSFLGGRGSITRSFLSNSVIQGPMPLYLDVVEGLIPSASPELHSGFLE